MNRCIILAAMPVTVQMREYCSDGDYVIAVDAGYENARTLCLTPDLYVGDFDSAPPLKNAQNIIRLAQDKDETDTYYAAKLAVERGFTDVVILGGLGGRFDHSLANMAALLYLAQHGVRAKLADENNEISVLLPGHYDITPKEDFYFSIYPIEATAKGVTLKHVKFPLENVDLHNTFPIGTSNEFRYVPASIEVKTGGLFLVLSRKE
ncbi:MAG: thiamine diphosphokinase [Oscillospiraceae bacterium]|nr:thiamine diphosphokinase [Oscillospiraceae bacterium]